MQTFLPYPDFARSFRCLDNRRIGNQVYRECLTIIRGGWPNHPASKMWKEHRPALALYALNGLAELLRRGRSYPLHVTYFEGILQEWNPDPEAEPPMPPWLGDERFHSSHRAALLFKDYNWYSQFGWSEEPAVPVNGTLPYFWPVR